MNYLIKPKQNKKGEDVLLLTHKDTSAHKIELSNFYLVDSSGNILKEVGISEELTKIFTDRLERYDPHQARLIPISLLQSDTDEEKLSDEELLDSVVHLKTYKESSYTSTGEKLSGHYPIFDKLKDTGYGSIIRATLTMHQRCTSRCPYCSTIARNKSDSITLEEAKDFVRKLYFDQAEYNRVNFPEYNDKYKEITGTDIRLKGIILSGGGQPNLWPHFAEFVEWLSELDIDLGLITNGFPKNVADEVYDKFKWVRISITPEDASPHYIDKKFENQYIPPNLKNSDRLTVGYSYVFGEWTDDAMLTRLQNSAVDNGFEYVRVLTDCNLTRNDQLCSHKRLSDSLLRVGLIDEQGDPTGRIFHQLKYHGTHDEASSIWTKGQCLLQSYNVFWDTTGHDEKGYSSCYPCDSVTVLADGDNALNPSPSTRRFDASTYGTYKNTEVEKLYNLPLTSFFDPRETCSSCLFMRNNATISKHLSGEKDLNEVYNDNVDNLPNHINFP